VQIKIPSLQIMSEGIHIETQMVKHDDTIAKYLFPKTSEIETYDPAIHFFLAHK